MRAALAALAMMLVGAGSAQEAKAATLIPDSTSILRYSWGAIFQPSNDLEHTFYFSGSIEVPSEDQLRSVGKIDIQYTVGQKPILTGRDGVNFANSMIEFGSPALTPKIPLSNAYAVPGITGSFTAIIDGYGRFGRFSRPILQSDVLNINGDSVTFPDGTIGRLYWNTSIFADEKLLYSASYYSEGPHTATVPVPASGILLLSVLSGIGGMGLRRKLKAA